MNIQVHFFFYEYPGTFFCYLHIIHVPFEKLSLPRSLKNKTNKKQHLNTALSLSHTHTHCFNLPLTFNHGLSMTMVSISSVYKGYKGPHWTSHLSRVSCLPSQLHYLRWPLEWTDYRFDFDIGEPKWLWVSQSWNANETNWNAIILFAFNSIGGVQFNLEGFLSFFAGPEGECQTDRQTYVLSSEYIIVHLISFDFYLSAISNFTKQRLTQVI